MTTDNSRADALTDDEIAERAQQHLATREACDIYQFRRDELLAFIRQCLTASPVEQSAAAPIYRCKFCGSTGHGDDDCDALPAAAPIEVVSGTVDPDVVDALIRDLPAPSPADERAAQELLPIDRKWVPAKAISLVAEYRNCKASETEEVMQRFVDYMQAALQDATARAPRRLTAR